MKQKGARKPESKPKKDKGSQQRLRTFNSSEFSLWEQKNQMLASATDLSIFHNETISRKRAAHSALSQYGQNNTVCRGGLGKPAQKKKKKTNSTKNKTNKSRSKPLLEEYEMIRYKESHSNSQIVFSNDQTKRDSAVDLKSVRADLYLDQLQANSGKEKSNLILRVNIKKEYLRKVEAATKIQKVYRGYMMRKLLSKYIADRTLRDRSWLEHISQVSHQLRTQGQKSQGSPTFRENEDLSDQRGDFKVNELSQDGGFSARDAEFEAIKQEAKNQERLRLQNNSESSESSAGDMVYRHQNPIYSQEQISDFLQSSEEDEEEWNDAYEPDIIFETNEEYLESRKSSLQNKNQPLNKLSNKGLNDIALLHKNEEGHAANLHLPTQESEQYGKERDEERTIKYGEEVIQKGGEQFPKNTTEKISFRVEGQKIKEASEESQSSSDAAATSKKNSSKHSGDANEKETGKYEEQVKENSVQKYSQRSSGVKKMNMCLAPEDLGKYLDEYENGSEKSGSHSRQISEQFEGTEGELQNNGQIFKLREQQCERWDEVIRMVSSQIKKNQQSNDQMIHFMKTIMEFSQKNKELLGSTRSINLETYEHTTPTSMETQLHTASPPQPTSEQPHQEQSVSPQQFFKKKKDLRIDIVEEQDEDKIFQELRQSSSFKKSSKIKSNSFVVSAKKEADSCPINESQISANSSFDPFERRPTHFKKNKPVRQHFQTLPSVPRLDSTTKLKSFFSSTMQIHDQAINQVLRLREELLQKRESQELMKLNAELGRGSMNQTEFIEKLQQLTKKFSEEKDSIDKAKQDIIKGYQAANDLMKDYFYDVRRLGIKMTVSRSQDNLKYKTSPQFLKGSDILIDEMTPKSTPKSIRKIFQEHQIENKSNNQPSENDSEVQFTDEELKRFRKAANFNFELNELNGNMTTISEDFIRQQQTPLEHSATKSVFQMSPETPQTKGRQPQKETYQLQEERASSERAHPYIDSLVGHQIDVLVWQFACQLILKPIMTEKFIDRNHLVRPQMVSQEERRRFIQILTQNLSEKGVLHRKLNQKITPIPAQILKCMRLDFSEDDEDDDEEECYEEISKYQFVISQEVCVKSVMVFKNELDEKESQQQLEIQNKNRGMLSIQDVKNYHPATEKLEKFISQREKFLSSRKQHTKDLRWEVMNIELHCIFDSWNEQIIKLCSQRPGFSGIGLNELTLSMIDHNKPVVSEKCESIISESKKQVMQILEDDTELNAKILKDNFEEMCEHDSAWVFYADEALSYGLELVYLVEEDLYSELARQLRRIGMKNWF